MVRSKNMQTEKKKPGRPRVEDEEKRLQFQIRISAAEKDIFQEAARASGLPLAQWLRMVSLQAARKAR